LFNDIKLTNFILFISDKSNSISNECQLSNVKMLQFEKKYKLGCFLIIVYYKNAFLLFTLFSKCKVLNDKCIKIYFIEFIELIVM